MLFTLFFGSAGAVRRPPTCAGSFDFGGWSDQDRDSMQSFPGLLSLNWDSWTSSQVITTIQGIILQQAFGFDVELVELADVYNKTATADLYEAVSAGAIHAALEVWPAGKQEGIEQYGTYDASNSTGRSVMVPYSNLLGRSGIFETCRRDGGSQAGACVSLSTSLPHMLLGALASQAGVAHFSETAKTESVAAGTYDSDGSVTCTTGLGCDSDGVWRPPVCAAERNCSVQLKMISPAYDTGQVEGVILQLGIPVEVAWVGLKNWQEQVWDSYMNGLGGLFHAWEPLVPIDGIEMTSFQRTVMPSAIDMPETFLQKVYWPGLLENGQDAVTFFENFEISTEEVEALLARPMISSDVESSACTWIKENEETWSKWVVFPSRISEEFSLCGAHKYRWCHNASFMWLFLQGVASVLLISCGGCAYGRHKLSPEEVRKDIKQHLTILKKVRASEVSIMHTPTRKSRNHVRIKILVEANDALASMREKSVEYFAKTSASHWRIVAFMKAIVLYITTFLIVVVSYFKVHVIHRAFFFISDKRNVFHAREVFYRARDEVPTFFSHARTLDNFVKGNADRKLKPPPAGPADNWISGITRTDMWIFFFTTRTWFPYAMQCLGLGFLTGMLSTMSYMAMRWSTYKNDSVAWAAGDFTMMAGTFPHGFEQVRIGLEGLTANFLFFPSFLSIGFLGFAVNRWLSFQATGYCIQGRTQDLGLVIGGSIFDPESRASQELLFKLYRYLNLTHMFAYGSLGKCTWFTEVEPGQLICLGLLTKEEAAVLDHTPNLWRMDTVVSWISKDVQRGMHDGILNSACRAVLFKHLSDLRMWNANLAAVSVTAQPNLWSALMKILTDALVFMFVVGSVFRFFVYDYEDPYHNIVDSFNVDGLVCWSEQVIFTNMRAAFHSRPETAQWGDAIQAVRAESRLSLAEAARNSSTDKDSEDSVDVEAEAEEQSRTTPQTTSSPNASPVTPKKEVQRATASLEVDVMKVEVM